MSFVSIFKTPLQEFAQTSKKLDQNLNVFCNQLAHRLNIDERSLKIELQACLQLFFLNGQKAQKTLETPIQTQVETTIQTQLETPVEAPVEAPVETPVETPVEIPIETPVEDELIFEEKTNEFSLEFMYTVEQVDFDIHPPVPIEDLKFWVGDEIKINKQGMFLATKTNFVISQDEDGEFILIGRKNGGKVTKEENLPQKVKEWAQKCGIHVLSLEYE